MRKLNLIHAPKNELSNKNIVRMKHNISLPIGQRIPQRKKVKLQFTPISK